MLILAVACTPDPAGPHRPRPGPPAPTVPPTALVPPQVAVTVDPTVSTAAVASWTGPVERATVTFRQGDEARTVCATGDVSELRLPLLRIGEPVDWTAELVVDAAGTVHEQAGSLPAPAVADLPTFVVTSVDLARSEIADRLLILSLLDPTTDASFAVIVDGAGHARFAATVPLERSITRVHLGRDRRSVLFSHFPRDLLADDATVTRIALDGGPPIDTPVQDQHHDFVELPDGRLAWLSFEAAEHEVDEGVPVMADHVLVGEEGSDAGLGFPLRGRSGPPAELFSFERDYPVDPWLPCAHASTVGIWVPGYQEWTHSNSIVAADDGGLFVLARNLDALIRLDAAGTMRWQLGGRDATLQLLNDPGFSHPHFSWAEGDRVLVFDNAVHSGNRSRVVELRIDEAAGTAERVWELYEPEGRYISVLGDARRLPGGNTLVAVGSESQLFEVTPDGEIVWWMDVVSPDGTLGSTLYRVTFAEDLDGPWLCR
jgi:hypothetical protein